LNNKGELFLLTTDRNVNVLNHNDDALGCEAAAPEQVAVTTAQYEALIYASAQFLLDNGYITKNESISSVVNRVVKGHEALGGQGDHDDQSRMVVNGYGHPIVAELIYQILKARGLDGYTL